MKGNIRIEQIEKVNISDKWMEFWFKGCGRVEDRTYNLCSKTYRFYDAVERSKLDNHILNYGCVNLFMKWMHDGSNWEIEEVSIEPYLDEYKRYKILVDHVTYGGPASLSMCKATEKYKNLILEEAIAFIKALGLEFKLNESLATKEDCMGCYSVYWVVEDKGVPCPNCKKDTDKAYSKDDKIEMFKCPVCKETWALAQPKYLGSLTKK